MKTWPFALILAIAASAPQARAQANAAFAATTLSLSGSGEVSAAPDQATASLGVSSQAQSAAEALRLNSETMARVVAALKAQGVADKDIQTSGLNVQAQYAFAQNQARRFTGYQASNRVTVSVDDLGKLGALIDGAVTAGANEVDGVSFGLKSPRAAEDKARLEAVKALKAKADLYAEATGYRIARLVSLSEGGEVQPAARPLAMQEVVVTARRLLPPVQAGQLTVRVDVNAVYELTR